MCWKTWKKAVCPSLFYYSVVQVQGLRDEQKALVKKVSVTAEI